ncbi:beta-lactamase family protein [Lutibacter sp. A80]|uniref:serine hydrolase domain-containing protein n=1 Tax=Lutibacter sp. A80 TaxID=2918453 RepID=UPI001F06552F|nr:serine hydrolase [Lutibacter sp. A80]UMB60760.1 beta-lactamase family protein [Lutibacter sp. A80]
MKKYQFPILLFISLFSCSQNEDLTLTTKSLYFPTLAGDDWETIAPSELNWDEHKIEELLTYLEAKNTKSFIVLYNGRIAIEQYFNNHSESKPWYWASAGKTLTSVTTGIAQEKGLLNINTKVSDYLGNGWTSASTVKENLITCKHLLTMTSGLDDDLGDAVNSINLQYKADAGTRWAYHNVYVKLQDVIEATAKQPFSTFFNTNLRDKIGMTGIWLQTGDFSVFYSTARSMARFGLLAFNKGTWDTTEIINADFFNNSISTSQNINNAYGYLWWLNGKSNYHLPQSQFEFQGALIPNAPNDLYAALGKNDQKIYVSPSKKLVIIRMGESADATNFALSNFDNELWEKLNLIID